LFIVTASSDVIDAQVRIFSYLTVDDGELFPGRLACNHRGSMRKLTSGENLISEMSNYFEFLSTSAVNRGGGLWTSPYLDAWGLGLLITHAIPCISDVDGR
jgi:voltage-dependent calcium channel alpha-2/delta-3